MMSLDGQRIGRYDMFNVQTLMEALPTFQLEPERMASIRGFSAESWESITLWEPPAGKNDPFIEPISALTTLYSYIGMDKDMASQQANNDVVELFALLAPSERVIFFDLFESDSREYISAPALMTFSHKRQHLSEHIISFLERAISVTSDAPVFEYEDERGIYYTLAQRPALPHPKAMFDFVPGVPWGDLDDGRETDQEVFLIWRDSMRPIAQALESILGESPYYFCEWGDELDDDNIHRFLLMHWCCTFKPEAPFIQYIMRASGAETIEELKSALVDPKNYVQPFKQYCAFMNAEANSCTFRYLPNGTRRAIGLAFSTPAALNVADFIIRENIDADIYLAAPSDLLYDKTTPLYCENGFILADAMRYAHYAATFCLIDHVLAEPISFLANIDELVVIDSEKRTKDGQGLLLDDSIAELLCLALELKIPAEHYSVNRIRRGNPKYDLEKNGVPHRVARIKAAREIYTKQLPDLNISSEWSSSALWRMGGGMIRYDNLAVPFELIRRINSWQREYDATLNITKDDTWWDSFDKEGREIAEEFYRILSPTTKVFYEGEPVA